MASAWQGGSAANAVRRRLSEEAFAQSTVQVIVAFGAFVFVALGLRRLTRLGLEEAGSPWLLAEAVKTNPLALAVVAIAAVALAATGRRLLTPWSELDRGHELRAFATVLVVLLTWRYATNEYNYFFTAWYTADRIALVGLAAACWIRPIALVPFIIQARLLTAPMELTFQGFSPDQTIDGLALITLTALAATVIASIALKSPSTHAFLSIAAAGLAAHFFTPGLSKVRSNWLTENDVANVPLNGYAQGWLGTSDGGFARALSDALSFARWPIVVVTVILEAGAIFLVLKRRSFMAALVAWIGFHLFVFAGYGFVFAEWILVEAGVLLLLLSERGRAWSEPVFRTLPVLIVLAAALFGRNVFQPPVFSWYDGNLVYAYDFDGVTTDGEDVVLFSTDLAPDDGPFAFGRLDLGPTPPLAAGYGAVSEERFELIETAETWADIEKMEGELDASRSDQRQVHTIDLIAAFILDTHRERIWADGLPGPPAQFFTSRSGERFESHMSLASLTITRRTIWRSDGGVQVRIEPVMGFTTDGVTVEWQHHESGEARN